MMMTLHYQLYNITKMCFRINTNYNTNIFIYIYSQGYAYALCTRRIKSIIILII